MKIDVVVNRFVRNVGIDSFSDLFNRFVRNVGIDLLSDLFTVARRKAYCLIESCK